MKIELCGGKYTVENNNGILKTWRYGEPWSKDKSLIGDGFVLALVQKIEDLNERIEKLEVVVKANQSITPHCYESNNDPYPLCVGGKSDACKKCCLNYDMSSFGE